MNWFSDFKYLVRRIECRKTTIFRCWGFEHMPAEEKLLLLIHNGGKKGPYNSLDISVRRPS